MEEDHRSGRTLRRDDAAVRDQLRDGLVVDRPQRIARRAQVVARRNHALLVAARNEHERPVELVHLIQEDRDVHRARLGHEVVARPGTVVLVPLPHVAVEGLLAVDLELVHVHRFVEHLHHGIDHPRMARELRERFRIKVRREIRAHRIASFLAHVLGTAHRVQARNLVGERLDLLAREEAREKEVAVAGELVELLRRELHGVS